MNKDELVYNRHLFRYLNLPKTEAEDRRLANEYRDEYFNDTRNIVIDTTGYLYFFYSKSINLTKIGRAKNSGNRLASLRLVYGDLENSLSVYVRDPIFIERHTHLLMRRFWVSGEWFKLPEELLGQYRREAFIRRLKKSNRYSTSIAFLSTVIRV